MWTNPKKIAVLLTFTKESLNGKLLFLLSVYQQLPVNIADPHVARNLSIIWAIFIFFLFFYNDWTPSKKSFEKVCHWKFIFHPKLSIKM